MPAPAVRTPLPHLSDCIYLDYNGKHGGAGGVVAGNACAFGCHGHKGRARQASAQVCHGATAPRTAGTTPIFPEVSAAMQPFLTQHFGNPSSGHAYGRACKAALEAARKQVAAMVNATPSEIFFTSCGTESDAWAIWGACASARRRRGPGHVPHVVASAVEHPAVLQTLAALQAHGLLTYTLVAVDAEGCVAAADVAAAVTPDTALVTLMHANNEVGSLQPVAEAAAAARRAGATGMLVHSDAAQSLGKVAVDVRALGVDMLTVVGHKLGAPKGVAALFVKQGVDPEPLLCGGETPPLPLLLLSSHNRRCLRR